MQLDWIGRHHSPLRSHWLGLVALLCCLCLPLHTFAEELALPTANELSTEDRFAKALGDIVRGSLPKRAKAISSFSTLEDARVVDVLAALQQGNLYATSRGELEVAIVTANKHISVLSGEAIASDAAAGLKRVPINNTMRGQLRSLVAQLHLNHKDASKRLDAVQRMIADGLDEQTLALLVARQQIEPSDAVRDAITTASALMNLNSSDEQTRLDAILVLRGSLLTDVRTALSNTSTNDSSDKVRQQAQFALDSIDDRIAVFRLAENIFFGLSLGSVLLLSAIGLAITFGVMGVINMAHGELMMIGAYVTWVVQQLFPNQIAYSLMIAIPSAFIVAGLVGIAIERGVIRFLYGRPLETLLATFGISLILQQAARSIFSPLNRAVELPAWMSGSLQINPVLSITYNRLYIFIFGLLVFFALLAILKKTSLGLKVRAVSQNRAMARAVGVRANWVDAMTFGLGSGIAGIAGVALSQLTNVGPNLGQAYIIDSFMVVVFGGVGNLWGTLVGAMGLGIINKFLEPYAGAVLAKVLVLVLLILFIQKRPKGLFPQKGRAAAD